MDVVYIALDGETDVPKAERTGCWPADFPKVLAYKSAYYMQIAVNDWERNVEGGVQAGLSQEESEDMMGPSPPAPEFFVDTARKAGGTKPRRTQAQVSSEEDAIASGARHEQTEDDRCRERPPDVSRQQQRTDAALAYNRGAPRMDGNRRPHWAGTS